MRARKHTRPLHSRGAGAAAVLLAAMLWSTAASAYSLLPLVTEEVEPLPSGVAQATLGLAYFKDGRLPLFTPQDALESQNVLDIPQFAFRIGAGGWVEIQAGYQLVYESEQTSDGQTNTNYGSGDATIFTKVRVLHEGEMYPALGVRFGTKLPNGNRELHLGTDETDFGGEILATKHFGPVTAHLNFGLVLLGVPQPLAGETFHGGQDDVFSYSVAVVSRPLGGDDDHPDATRLTLMGEVAGLAGSRFSNDRAAIQLGTQIVTGASTFYLGVSAGLITESEDFGCRAGYTYTFDLAKLFAD